MTRELQEMIRRLSGQDWWTRQRSIASLMAYPEDEYFGFLEEGIKDHENANIRNSAMEIYKALGTKALPSLAMLMKDDDPEVRLFTANVLCDIRDEKSLPLLFGLITDTDINVRIASAEALGKIGDARALDRLKEALKDETWVAMAAIHALGDIGGDEPLRLLYECLQIEKYREITITAIEMAGDKGSIRYLTPFLDNAALRQQALKVIIKIADRERIRPQPEYFLGIVPLLIEMTGSRDPEIKRHGFIALAWSEDIRGLPSVLDALQDEDLQEYAIEGILSIGKKAVCNIVDELKGSAGGHRIILAKLLGMLGENMALLQFAEDADPEVRVEVALAIGSLELERASQTLDRMLSDPNEEVRLAARRSVSRLKNE